MVSQGSTSYAHLQPLLLVFVIKDILLDVEMFERCFVCVPRWCGYSPHAS